MLAAESRPAYLSSYPCPPEWMLVLYLNTLALQEDDNFLAFQRDKLLTPN
jgi:hypothetical protein